MIIGKMLLLLFFNILLIIGVLYWITYRSFGKEYLEKFLNQEVERFLTNLIFQEIQVTGEEAQQVEFSISFYTYALVGIGLDWIEKQMPSTADELVEKIERVMLGSIISNF